MSALLRDLCLAARSLARSPGFTLVASLSLALGIGVNAVVFSVVNALLFQPLPVADPSALVRLGSTTRGDGFGPFSLPEYRDLSSQLSSVSGVAAFHPNSITLNPGGAPGTEWMELVSANYFGVLGVAPALGRDFGPGDDQAPGQSAVTIVSDRLWRTRLGSRPDVVGATVQINGSAFTVVGVAPPGFRGAFSGFGIDLWIPVMMHGTVLPAGGSLDRRDDRFLMLLGRRRPGVDFAAVRTEAAVVAGRIRAAEPGLYRDYGIATADAGGVHPFVAGLVTSFLAMLQGFVGLVLLIAASNVANLFLARASQRRRELAVRSAIGAGRLALVRTVVAEALWIAALGAGLAVAATAVSGRLLGSRSLPVGVPLHLEFGLDGRVFGFTVLVGIVAVVAIGLAPALRFSRPAVLGDQHATGATAGRARLGGRAALIGLQVATATVLLIGADLLVQSLANSRNADPGFDSSDIAVLQAAPETLHYDESRVRRLWSELRSAAAALPGVRRTALALFIPLGDRGDQVSVTLPDAADRHVTQPYNVVAPGYFEVLAIPLVAGRDFDPTDRAGSPEVAIVSESAARRYFGDASPVGRTLTVTDRTRDRAVSVIGVARDVKHGSLADRPRPLLYLPFSQWYRPDMVLHAETGGDPAAMVGPLAAMARALEPDLAVTARTMAEATSFSLIPLRIAGTVLAVAGGIGFLLAVIGVFGVVAFAVSQRTREIGSRLALGAERGRVVGAVMRDGLRPTAIGVVIGLLAAVALGRVLTGLLVGVSALNPESVLLIPALLVGAGLVAAYLPGRRAARVDPAVVLRND
jgi:predicted permease